MNQPLDQMPIPLTWTGEQALDVATFLDELIQTIWQAHGDAMARALELRRGPPPEDRQE